MTDINTQSLPLLAVLRKGAPKNGNRPGEDLDYFRVDFRTSYEHLAGDFTDLYGEQPTILPGVRFLSDRPWSWYFEKWGRNRTLQIRHDGQHYLKRWTDQGYDYTPDPVSGEDLSPTVCQGRGRLVFLLADFFAQTGVVGKLMLTTSSGVDRGTIESYLGTIRLMHIPLPLIDFTLARVPRQFTVPIKGKPSSVTKHMIALEADPAVVRAQIAASSALRLGARRVDPATGEIFDTPALAEGDMRQLYQHELEALYAYAKDIALTKDDVLAALDVAHIGQWVAVDPFAEGREMLHDYINAQIETEATA